MKISSAGYSKYLKLALYIAVVILVNIAGVTLFLRGDLTSNKAYSVSEVSKDVVSNLKATMTINVFFTKNLPAPHNNTEQYLQDLLKEYSFNGNRYFNYQFIDVSPETDGITKDDSDENREMARRYGIHPVNVRMVEKDKVEVKRAYMGLVLIHDKLIERIPTITTTEGLEYKLTTAMQKLSNKVSALKALEEKVQLKLAFSSSIFEVAPYMGMNNLKAYPTEIKDAVETLAGNYFNKLDFAQVDPTKDPAQGEALKKMNIRMINWPAIPEANIAPGEGYFVLTVQYKDKIRVIPLLQAVRFPIVGTQYQLTDMESVKEGIRLSVERIVDINKDIGYLADHGTLSTRNLGPQGGGDSIGKFNTLLSKTYTLKSINLKEKNIPDGLKCLIIARPTEKLSDYALYQIDQALMSGTNIAVFADAFKQMQPPMQQPMMANQMPTYVPLDTGLEKMLAHYGVRIKKAFVLDENCYKRQMTPREGGGEQSIYTAPIIKSKNINKELDFIKNIKGMVAFQISPLELDQKRIEEQKITAHQILASSDRSWQMRDRINLNPMFMRPPANDKEMSSQPLAYMLEGSFTSYFKGKPMPEKPAEKKAGETPENPAQTPENPAQNSANADSEKTAQDADKTAPKADKKDLSVITEKGALREKSPQAKIFVIASSEMLKDQLVDDEGQSTNAMFVMNMIDTLNDQDHIAVMRTKAQQFNPLDETTPATRTLIKIFNIGGLPILVVIFGLIIWLRRHARRKKIQLQFQA